MEHSDFKIGILFRTGSGLWRCTDLATRTIAAIQLVKAPLLDDEHRDLMAELEQAEKQGHFNGPPYAVAEHSFDENDFGGCWPNNLGNFPGYDDRPSKIDWSKAVRGPYKKAVAILRERRAQALRESQLPDADRRDALGRGSGKSGSGQH